MTANGGGGFSAPDAPRKGVRPMSSNEFEFTARRQMPVLPLRGLSVFPGMLLNFDVERQMSVAALNFAMSSDQILFLTAQKDIRRICPSATTCLRSARVPHPPASEAARQPFHPRDGGGRPGAGSWTGGGKTLPPRGDRASARSGGEAVLKAEALCRRAAPCLRIMPRLRGTFRPASSSTS